MLNTENRETFQFILKILAYALEMFLLVKVFQSWAVGSQAQFSSLPSSFVPDVEQSVSAVFPTAQLAIHIFFIIFDVSFCAFSLLKFLLNELNNFLMVHGFKSR